LAEALREARQAVVGERLVGHRVGGELVHVRADAGVAVEAAEADRDDRVVLGIRRVGVAAAVGAEALAPAALRVVGPHELRPLSDGEGALGGERGHREGAAGAALAALAVAVEGAEQRLLDPEADAAAHAATDQRLEGFPAHPGPNTPPAPSP